MSRYYVAVTIVTDDSVRVPLVTAETQEKMELLDLL